MNRIITASFSYRIAFRMAFATTSKRQPRQPAERNCWQRWRRRRRRWPKGICTHFSRCWIFPNCHIRAVSRIYATKVAVALAVPDRSCSNMALNIPRAVRHMYILCCACSWYDEETNNKYYDFMRTMWQHRTHIVRTTHSLPHTHAHTQRTHPNEAERNEKYKKKRISKLYWIWCCVNMVETIWCVSACGHHTDYRWKPNYMY